jgi:hypothetical protein
MSIEMSVTRRKREDLKFWPRKYYKGLSWAAKTRRRREIKARSVIGWKNPKAYVPFKTDKGVKTRKSSYVEQWNKLHPDATSIEAKAKITGVPEGILTECYNRGMAAWRTGHRPGATEQQWGYARVASFLVCGKTHYGPDADLVKKAKKQSAKARRWWAKTC